MKIANEYRITYSIYDNDDGRILVESKRASYSGSCEMCAILKLKKNMIRRYRALNITTVIHAVETHWHEL